tara:strand:- start:2845 stop:3060 length:216 start_codon:yes stop_codon:yes gene_type:complete
MNMSLAELLNLRSEWEELVIKFKLPDGNGTIDNLIWFLENGSKSNRFRHDYKKAKEIAATILDNINRYDFG